MVIQRHTACLVYWFVWFVLFIWLNQTNQTDQISRQTGLAPCFSAEHVSQESNHVRTLQTGPT